MDFKLVVQKVLSRFDEEKIEYGVIGGYALGLWALENDPVREARELEDMRALFNASEKLGRQVDWDLLKDYFDLFDRGFVFQRLRSDYGKAE